VGFRLVVLALGMLMGSLMMVMSSGLVGRSSVLMMLLRRVFGRLSHLVCLLWFPGSLRLFLIQPPVTGLISHHFRPWGRAAVRELLLRCSVPVNAKRHFLADVQGGSSRTSAASVMQSLVLISFEATAELAQTFQLTNHRIA
jgi:hypothetical protein